MARTQKPPCARWGCWEGHEVEGSLQYGERTLFVRRLPKAARLREVFLKYGEYNRVWICHEFYSAPCPHRAHTAVLISENLWQIADLLNELKPDEDRILALEVNNGTLTALKSSRTFSRLLKHASVSLYYKAPISKNSGLYRFLRDRREGDHLCLGPAFGDYIVRACDMQAMDVTDYLHDTCLDQKLKKEYKR